MTKRQAELLSITVPLAWGTSYTFMKFGMEGVMPMTLVALRCGIAFFVMAAVFFRKVIQVNRRLLLYSAAAGALLYGVFLCLLYGVNGTSASTAGFLQSMTVVIVPILHAILKRELPPKKIMAGVAASLAGLYLLSGGKLSNLNMGAMCCILSSVLYAVHILLSKRFVKEVDALCLGIWQLGFAAAYAVITACLLEQPTLPQTVLQWASILGLALICSAYGFVMQAVLQRYVSPETTGFMFSLEPVFSALFAYFFLHERMGASGYMGALLILAGVLIANTTSSLRLPHIRQKDFRQQAG